MTPLGVPGEIARELASLQPAGQAERDAAWTRLTARLDEELVAKPGLYAELFELQAAGYR